MPTTTPPAPSPQPRQYYPWLPPGARTGRAAIDDVLFAFERGDVDRLMALTSFTSYACEGPGNVQPHPKRCPDGVAEGTLLQGLPIVHVEGGLFPREKTRDFYASQVPTWQSTLYGVFSLSGDAQDVLVLFAPPSLGERWFDQVRLISGRIQSITFQHSDAPVDGLFDPAVELWLLPPRPVVPPEAIDFARDIARRVESGELGNIVREGRPTMYRCSAEGFPEIENGIAAYSDLCRGVPGGEFRQGFSITLHGSHGGPRDAEDLIEELLAFEKPGPWQLLTVGCRVAEWGCPEFVIAFGSGDGTISRAMYLVFDMTVTPPAVIGAGLSGDNVGQILQGYVTLTALGETHFYAVSPGP